jgi:hypothetical protein
MADKRNDSAKDGELNFRSDFLLPKGTHQVDVEAPCTVDTQCTLLFFFLLAIVIECRVLNGVFQSVPSPYRLKSAKSGVAVNTE